MKNTELPARRTARAPGREREMKARLLGSLVLGAIAAATVVIYDDTANHAALVRAAARNHQTVVSSLASGFAGLTLIVAAVVFVAGTVVAAPPQGAAGCRATRVAGRRGAAAPWPRGFVAVTADGDHRTRQQSPRTGTARR